MFVVFRKSLVLHWQRGYVVLLAAGA